MSKKPGDKPSTPKGTHQSPKTEFKPGNTSSEKYKAEYVEQILDYFRSSENYPTFDGFAVQIHVGTKTLYNWREGHPQFNKAYEECLSIQRNKLIQGGLDRTYDSNFAKFIAQNCHGMKEQVEINLEQVTMREDL